MGKIYKCSKETQTRPPRQLLMLTSAFFCPDPYSKKKNTGPAVNPKLQHIDSGFNASRIRQDKWAKRLLSLESEIRSGQVKITWHRNCNSRYVSAANSKDLVHNHQLSMLKILVMSVIKTHQVNPAIILQGLA